MQSLNPKHQLKSIEDLFQKNLLNAETKNNIGKIKTMEQEIVRDNLQNS